MECEKYLEQASRFIDAQLGAGEQEEFFAHLTSCGGCRQFLESSVRIRQTVRSEHITVPAGVDEALFEAIARRGLRSRAGMVRRFFHAHFWSRRWTLPAPAFAILIALAIGVGILASSMFLSARVQTALPVSLVSGQPVGDHQRTVIVVYSLPEEQVVGVVPAGLTKPAQQHTY